ncbi:MAG TPA: LacI family transcriptional regulator [Herpetosiphon sp.]|uniref:Periplasmic binding protein/LacI transcriptional regulator n=1 Tax=Herpetosiphon aurantiacus (strain ATCC 23779 / DSM 785 / 114-95) TaxID=316274 RepID=A9AWB1_HERA2|nr:ABC transporter substrate-binding protein [Herpetosiphon sp.]ABX04761.1 periplasmic binding protein/LacI transcriptional regulator [Herpetosiphon aurantiacus DSM 785]HBW49985.1 LacI family transcriptional regulator [Herpetosiphon sp.]
MNALALCRCAIALAIAWTLAACGGSSSGVGAVAPSSLDLKTKTYPELVVGFAQIGAESEWRTANTRSIQDTANQLGVELALSDAQQQQENQIKAIRSFIAQGVDVIGVSPVVETGWDEVFAEVKQAGIPLILLDRNANVPDDLYSVRIGSDFVEEGRRACGEMARLLDGQGAIVVLEGTQGSAPMIGRGTGFQECLQSYPALHIIDSQSGDFIRARGKEEMAALLQKHGNSIDGVFAQNDDMALGAIEAIEEYGLRPGVDIKIVSIDAVRAAFEAMIDGKLNATIECNPLLGPLFFATALNLANGIPVEKWIKPDEGIYRQDTAAQELSKREY